MCIIIYKPQSVKIKTETALKAVSLNTDGFGVTWLDSGKTEKTLSKPEGFLWAMSERPYVFHARLTTRGTSTVKNAHPYLIKDGWYLYHNGTVHMKTSGTESDTAALAKFLRNFDKFDTKMVRDILSISDSRFIITNGKDVIKFGDWKERNDIYYSKSNVLDYELFFSYGAFSSRNSEFPHVTGATFVGLAKSKNKVMVDKDNGFILNSEGDAMHVNGQVYCISKSDMNIISRDNSIDQLAHSAEIKLIIDNTDIEFLANTMVVGAVGRRRMDILTYANAVDRTPGTNVYFSLRDLMRNFENDTGVPFLTLRDRFVKFCIGRNINYLEQVMII